MLVGLTGAVFGLGLGLAYAAIASLIVQSVPAEQTGVAAGMNPNIRTIGTAVVATVITSTAGSGGCPAESGCTAGFLIVAAIAIVALIVSFLVPVRHHDADTTPASAQPTNQVESELESPADPVFAD